MDPFIPFNSTILIQLFIAMLLGMLLGTERTIAHKTAGLRTYGLVAMGSALFIILAQSAMPALVPDTSFDLMRVVSGIVTGVGFIGAGMILHKEQTVTGLTTAAGLWVAAGIGIAVGLEQYATAIFATVLTLIAFTFFWYLEQKVEHFSDET